MFSRPAYCRSISLAMMLALLIAGSLPAAAETHQRVNCRRCCCAVEHCLGTMPCCRTPATPTRSNGLVIVQAERRAEFLPTKRSIGHPVPPRVPETSQRVHSSVLMLVPTSETLQKQHVRLQI